MSSLWPLQRLLGPHLSSHHPQQRQRKRVGVVSTCKTFKESQALGVKVACLILTSTNTVFWQAELTVMRSNGIACRHRLKPPPKNKRNARSLGVGGTDFQDHGERRSLWCWREMGSSPDGWRPDSRADYCIDSEEIVGLSMCDNSQILYGSVSRRDTLACAFFRQSEPGLS